MITDEKWFTEKYGNTPTFTASIRRQERHYGQPIPVRRSWFSRNFGYLMFLLTGFGTVLCFAAIILLTFELLPNAIDVELDRQLAVVEQQFGGKK
jgi:hypothetical protein